MISLGTKRKGTNNSKSIDILTFISHVSTESRSNIYDAEICRLSDARKPLDPPLDKIS